MCYKESSFIYTLYTYQLGNFTIVITKKKNAENVYNMETYYTHYSSLFITSVNYDRPKTCFKLNLVNFLAISVSNQCCL